VTTTREVSQFVCKFKGEGSRSPTTLGVRKLESLGNHVVLFAWSFV